MSPSGRMGDKQAFSTEAEQRQSGDADSILRKAREALDAAHFALADELIADRLHDAEALIENLQVYQAELELQNQQLRESRLELDRTAARFSAFFASLPIAELILDAKGFIREANPAAEDLFGHTLSRLRRSTLTRLVADTDRPRLVDALASADEAAEAELSEVEFLRAGDQTLIGNLRLCLLPSEGNAEPELICAIVNTTALIHQRDQLRRQARALERKHGELARINRLYRTLHASNQAIVRCTNEEELLPEICRITLVEGGFSGCRISRPDPRTGTLITVAAGDAVPGGDPHTNAGEPDAGQADGANAGSLPNGRTFPLSGAKGRIGLLSVGSTDPAGYSPAVLHLLSELADVVTKALEHFDTQAQLIQAERMAAIGAWAGEVAHELNNPLMGVINAIQYCLEQTPPEDPQHAILRDAERFTRRCVSIASGLHDLPDGDNE